MERVLFVTRLTLSIDRLEGDTVAKTLAHYGSEFRGRKRPTGDKRFVMTFRALVREGGVTSRNLSGVKESFASALLENPDGGEPGKDRQ